MSIDSAKRLLSLTTPLGTDALLVERVSGAEHVSALFSFTLELVSETEDIDFSKVVGKSATLSIRLADDSQRYWNGVIGRFTQVGSEESRYRYRAELVPWLWLLQHTADSRIFQDQSVPDIIEAVFKARGFSDFKTSLSQSYAARPYCVQYRESDFAFVSRLMEEEGIFYYFEHADGQHTMVLADASSAIAACAVKSSVPYRPKAGSGEGDAITLWMQSLTVVPAKVTLDDYDFTQSTVDLSASSPSVASSGKQSALDVYDYPGGYSQVSNGEHYAELRMQEWEARQLRVDGGGDCRTLAAGYSFTLAQHYRDDFNGDYLLLSVRHEALNNLPWSAGDGHYENRFECQPKATVFRPPRRTPRPLIHGAQSAVVVGPSGEEIYTDQYGRVKVQFHWDRLGKNDDKSSCWIRVSQGWAGLAWGSLHIPRVGQEVIVDFFEGDPDQPIITGRVYNAQKTVPYTLPDNKTQSGLKSRSSPNGTAENFNELRFEDKKGSEDVVFQAEKDFHRIVKNDDDLQVTHDRTITVKNNLSETVSEGNYSQTVTKGTHTRTIEGDTLTEIKTGKHTLQVDTGDSIELVKQGNRSVEVSVGSDTLTIKSGDQTTKISTGKSSTEAGTSIELTVGSNSIKIDQSGITIKAAQVTVQATGSASVNGASVDVTSQGDANVSGINVNVTAQIGATLKGNATAEVSASGQTTVKGGIVMIN
jgi:type VI secretion system secreted protein VgrG